MPEKPLREGNNSISIFVYSLMNVTIHLGLFFQMLWRRMISVRRSGIRLAMDILKIISSETTSRGTTIRPHSPANNSNRLGASEMKTTSKLSRSAEQNVLVST